MLLLMHILLLAFTSKPIDVESKAGYVMRRG